MAHRITLILVNIDIFMEQFSTGGTEEQLEHYLMELVEGIAEIYPAPAALKEDIMNLMSVTARAIAMQSQLGDE